jgi:uncharacterized protein DUF4280
MGLAVVDGAVIVCSFGTIPSTLIAASRGVTVQGMSVVTVEDHEPDNLGNFGFCMQDNQPCTPITPAPWVRSCTRNEIDDPVLSSSATLRCAKCGTISIQSAGQATVTAEDASQRLQESRDVGGRVPVAGGKLLRADKKKKSASAGIDFPGADHDRARRQRKDAVRGKDDDDR